MDILSDKNKIVEPIDNPYGKVILTADVVGINAEIICDKLIITGIAYIHRKPDVTYMLCRRKAVIEIKSNSPYDRLHPQDIYIPYIKALGGIECKNNKLIISKLEVGNTLHANKIQSHVLTAEHDIYAKEIDTFSLIAHYIKADAIKATCATCNTLWADELNISQTLEIKKNMDVDGTAHIDRLVLPSCDDNVIIPEGVNTVTMSQIDQRERNYWADILYNMAVADNRSEESDILLALCKTVKKYCWYEIKQAAVAAREAILTNDLYNLLPAKTRTVLTYNINAWADQACESQEATEVQT